MDLQQELFYAVVNCDHPKIYNLLKQGANIHFFFSATKFIRFWDENRSAITHVFPQTYLLTVLFLLCNTINPLQVQYGSKQKMADWIMFDKSKLASVKNLSDSHYEDTFIFLLHCGASLNQAVPYKREMERKTSIFIYIIEQFLSEPKKLYKLVLKLIANVKINFNADSLEYFRESSFRRMMYESYKDCPSSVYIFNILKIALLHGLTMPEYTRRQRKKWARDTRSLLDWNKFMLLYCFSRRNVNAFMMI